MDVPFSVEPFFDVFAPSRSSPTPSPADSSGTRTRPRRLSDCPVRRRSITVGVLLFGKAPLPRAVLAIPLLWAPVGSTAALTLGVYQDLGLPVAGVVALVMLIWPDNVPVFA